MKKTTKKTTTTKSVSAPPASVLPPKPAATVKPSVSAAPVKSAPPVKPTIITAAAPITIEAKVDVGFGNHLFLRGQGEGLSWERGIPLENVDSQTWRLTVPAKDKVQFKLLINDAVWAKGEDLVAIPGKKLEVTPAF